MLFSFSCFSFVGTFCMYSKNVFRTNPVLIGFHRKVEVFGEHSGTRMSIAVISMAWIHLTKKTE